MALTQNIYATQKIVRESLRSVGVDRIGSDAVDRISGTINEEIERMIISDRNAMVERIVSIGKKLRSILEKVDRSTAVVNDVDLALDLEKD